MIPVRFRDEIFEKISPITPEDSHVIHELGFLCEKMSCENRDILGLPCRGCKLFELWLSNEYLESLGH